MFDCRFIIRKWLIYALLLKNDYFKQLMIIYETFVVETQCIAISIKWVPFSFFDQRQPFFYLAACIAFSLDITSRPCYISKPVLSAIATYNHLRANLMCN